MMTSFERASWSSTLCLFVNNTVAAERLEGEDGAAAAEESNLLESVWDQTVALVPLLA